MLEDKIINNSYDAVDYGQGALSQSPIAISPLVSEQYEEAISENIEDVYTKKKQPALTDCFFQ